jgi:hypothetical protein
MMRLRVSLFIREVPFLPCSLLPTAGVQPRTLACPGVLTELRDTGRGGTLRQVQPGSSPVHRGPSALPVAHRSAVGAGSAGFL